MILDARITTGELKVKNARMQKIEVKVSARNGIIRLAPLNLNLYAGNMAATGMVDVQKDQPATALQLALSGIQAGPLIKDLLDKELIQGALAAKIDLRFIGDATEAIRNTLSGNGDLRFNDGAIVGIDLASMVRNVQTAFGLAQKTTEKPRTDFAELLMPFTITNGLFKTDASKLSSPLIRVLATGSADLAKETLDFRVEPKFVATLQGQGDTAQRAGIMVPVIVSGKFASPKFKPDLSGLLGQQLPDKEALQKMVPSKEKLKEDIQKLIPPKEATEEKMREGIKGLLKGLPIGNQQ
jgi:AsmA protein